MYSKKRIGIIALVLIAVVGIVAFAMPRMSHKPKYPEGKSYMKEVGKQLDAEKKSEKKAEFWDAATPEEALKKVEPVIQAALKNGKITEAQAEQKRNYIRQGFAKKQAGAKRGTK